MAKKESSAGKWRLVGAVLFVCSLQFSEPHNLPAETAPQEYENLQVLPPDISRRELGHVMLGNLSGLGLPRRGGRGCLHCHLGSMEIPRQEWDYASDDKIEKRKAREMMAMTADINARLAGLEGRIAPDLKVSCYTCHRGRIDPRPLDDLMQAAFLAADVDSSIAIYRQLREKYFAADAYDFRSQSLLGYAYRLTEEGTMEDGLALSRLNEEFNPGDVTVRRGTVVLEIHQALASDGVDGAMRQYEQAQSQEMAGVITPDVLDGLGWTLYRNDQKDEAIRIFRRNLAEFSERYLPNESLASALHATGEKQAGLSLLESWVKQHPADEQAKQVLANLRSRDD